MMRGSSPSFVRFLPVKLPGRDRRRGLTLLELVAVLVILAIVATVAVQSLQPQVEQARYERTRQVLESVRYSVLGQHQALQADGAPLISGFLADIGRLPAPAIGLSEPLHTERALDELWSPRSRLALEFPFRSRSGPPQPVDYTSIRLPCGWRGPYLHFGVGQDEIVDAWGRPLELEINERGEVLSVRSQPLPGLSDESPMKAELAAGLTTVSGVLQWGDQAPPPSVEAVLLVPDPRFSTEYLAVRLDEDEDPNAFLFSQVPLGLRAICIQIGERRVVRYVQVPQGGVTISVWVGGPMP